MPLLPETQGFRDAMDRLRDVMGGDVTFRIPQPKTWPPGTPLDPETGEPYDPAIQPTSSGFDDVVKHVGIVTKPISPAREGGDVRFEAGGEFSGMDAVLDVAAADYPDVQDATEVTVLGRHFKIIEGNPGDIAGVVDRYVVYLEAK